MNFLTTFIEKKFHITLDDSFYTPLKFGDFLRLEKCKENITESIKTLNRKTFLKTIQTIIDLQLGREVFLDAYSPDVVLYTVFEILNGNRLETELQFLKPPPDDGKESKTEIWHYPGRFYSQLIHILANNYHWELDKILQSDLNQLLFFIQEILVDAQMEREWTYGLSELAYKYNEGTKKSEFVPLMRPHWMDEKLKAGLPEKVRIPRSLLPYGVTNISGFETMSADEKPLSEEQSPNSTNDKT